MQKIEYISCIYHTVLVLKDVRLNSTHYLIKKIHNRSELLQIPIDHSADVD